MGNGLYIYIEEGLYQEYLYLNKQIMNFFKDPIYTRGVTPPDEASHKHLKRLTDTRLLMDAYTREERNIIFGES